MTPLVPRFAFCVVRGSETGHIASEGRLAHPPVKVKKNGMIKIPNFASGYQPSIFCCSSEPHSGWKGPSWFPLPTCSNSRFRSASYFCITFCQIHSSASGVCVKSGAPLMSRNRNRAVDLRAETRRQMRLPPWSFAARLGRDSLFQIQSNLAKRSA